MTLPSREITHIGYVVDDLKKSASWAIETLGAGPFFLIEHMVLETCTYNGAPAQLDHSSAFGQWGPTKLEFTVVHSADPPGLSEMLGGPGPKVGHVGWVADDLLADSTELEHAGLPMFHTGSTGPISTRWHDGRTRFGHHIEIHQNGSALQGFYELMRASAIGWDGTEPLRTPPPPA